MAARVTARQTTAADQMIDPLGLQRVEHEAAEIAADEPAEVRLVVDAAA